MDGKYGSHCCVDSAGEGVVGDAWLMDVGPVH